MGFAFPPPKEEREALDADELAELLVDAWRMCVPQKVVAAYEAAGS